MDNITFVGLDVHKATVCVSVAESGRGGEVRQIGVFENRPEVLSRMVTRLGKNGRRLNFCYEAGPCGYGLQRLLTNAGHECVVVAPSLIPIKAGDRVKTDRRDATMLAKLHRAGELTAIWVPDHAHEAMRDLVRARATAVRMLSKARQASTRLSAAP
jgi:transposase